MIVNAIFKKIMLKNMQKSLNAIQIKIQNCLDLNKNNIQNNKKNKKNYLRMFIIVQMEKENNVSRFKILKYFRIGLLRYFNLIYFYFSHFNQKNGNELFLQIMFLEETYKFNVYF